MALETHCLERSLDIEPEEAIKLAYLLGKFASSDFMEMLDRVIGNEIDELEPSMLCDAILAFT